MMRPLTLAAALFASTVSMAAPERATEAKATVMSSASDYVHDNASDAFKERVSEMSEEEQDALRERFRTEASDRGESRLREERTSRRHDRFVDEAREHARANRPEAVKGRGEDLSSEQRGAMKERVKEYSTSRAKSRRE
jgi:gas vesicle protein